MQRNSTQPGAAQWSQDDITQSAAELCARELFDVADNDSQYHRPVTVAIQDFEKGKLDNVTDDIAEIILAWSGAL